MHAAEASRAGQVATHATNNRAAESRVLSRVISNLPQPPRRDRSLQPQMAGAACTSQDTRTRAAARGQRANKHLVWWNFCNCWTQRRCEEDEEEGPGNAARHVRRRGGGGGGLRQTHQWRLRKGAAC